jgi:two-component system NtrC family response regulator
MRQAAETAAIVAATDWSVLIAGETGTGKEVFAKLVHRISERRDGPMIAVNCAAIPKELAESHLFGHLKGAFTGAISDQKGKFAAANGGTLFLDEIGELAPDLQAKLLRVLEDRAVEPLGSSKATKIDVRIIAATNRDLQQEINSGKFREDLYYRLREVEPIHLAPLRERRAEIPYLAIELLRQINQGLKKPRTLSKAALALLQEQPWRGNVRELRSVLKSSVLFAQDEILEPGDLKFAPAMNRESSLVPPMGPGFAIEGHLAEVKRQIIQHALDSCRGNQSAAAKKLGCSKQAVSKFMQSLTDHGR